MHICAMSGNNAAQKVELKKLITNGSSKSDLTNLNDGMNGGEGVPLSANLDIILLGVRADKTSVFKSATKPLLLPFWYKNKNDPEGSEKKKLTMMFKTGDDMRQDAIILQLFSVMDSAFQQVKLDFRFTIYNLIPLTKNDGINQFVPDCDTI